jgi:hypothetical protein
MEIKHQKMRTRRVSLLSRERFINYQFPYLTGTDLPLSLLSAAAQHKMRPYLLYR